jgi:hypothetical protein
MTVKDSNLNREYDNWVRKIAHVRNLKSLINHFREHVGAHYDRFDRSRRLNLDIWLVDVFNFMNILEKKNLKITKKDLLFKLALHYRNHKNGPKPNFDVNRFIKEYQGRYKKYDLLSVKDIQSSTNKHKNNQN